MSIIIPVYNVSDYIETCISSVMRQTYPHIECVIVDDASPDDSIEKCQRLIANYMGPISFLILHHDHNRGVSAARNTGTDAAKGDFIFYLDSDDEIAPYCIEKLVEPLMTDCTIEMVQGNIIKMGYYVTNENHIEVRDSNIVHKLFAFLQPCDLNSNEEVRTYFFEKNRLGFSAWNKLISSSFLKKNHICFKEGIKWEDGLWSFYVMKYLVHLHFVPDYTYIYKIHHNSIVTSTGEKERLGCWASIYEDIFSHFTSDDKDREIFYYFKPFCRHYLVSNGGGLYHKAYDLLWKALSDGKHYKALIRLYIVRLISKYAFNRWLFRQGLKVYRVCRNLYLKIMYMKK